VKRVKRVRGDKRRRGSRHYTTTTTTVLHVYVWGCMCVCECERDNNNNTYNGRANGKQVARQKGYRKILSYYVLLLLYSARICI